MSRNQQEISIDDLREYLNILSKVNVLKENEEFCGAIFNREYLLIKELSDRKMFSTPIQDNGKVNWFFLKPTSLSLSGERYLQELKSQLDWKRRFSSKVKTGCKNATIPVKLMVGGSIALVAVLSNLKNILN